MIKLDLLLGAAVLAILGTTGAAAQTADDVVVMRRAIANADVSKAPSQQVVEWKAAAWSPWSSTCAIGAKRTRDVACRRADGTLRDESLCTGAKPIATETDDRYEGCSFEWATGAFSAYSSTCAKSASRTRSVACEAFPTGKRTESFTTGDARCPAPVPTRSESTEVTTSCTYKWETTPTGGWTSTCSAANTRPVTAVCRRSDGEAVADSMCTGTKPTTEKAASCEMKNGGAETGDLTGWEIGGGGYGGAPQVSSEFAHTGRHSFKFALNGGANMYQQVRWPDGNGFRISYWIYVPETNGNIPTQCQNDARVTGTLVTTTRYQDIPKGVWTKVTSNTYANSPRSAGSATFQIHSYSTCNGQTQPVYVDDLTMEVFP